MENQVSTMLIQAVAEAKKSVKHAEYEFERGQRKIKGLASNRINLFGSSAVGTVTEIAAEIRKTNDAYYAACQVQVQLLDAQCRPLLAQNPDFTSVREVYEAIKWFNEQSEIKTIVNASVDSYDFGGVASTSYTPSIANKMIQTFWENSWRNHPGRKEAERKEREDKNKFHQEYNREYERWWKEYTTVQKLRDSEFEKLFSEKKADREKDIQEKYNQTIKNVKDEIEICKKKITEAQQKLSTLGIFQFREKKEPKTVVREMTSKIESLTVSIGLAEDRYREEAEALETWSFRLKEEVKNQLKMKYPLPKSPWKPTYGLEGMEMAFEYTRRAIYEHMQLDKKYTLDELIKSIPSLHDLSQSYVKKNFITPMLDEYIAREEENGVYYYLI